MKKKLVAVLLTCSMVASLLSACGNEDDSSSKKDETEDVDEEDEDDGKDKNKDKDKEVAKAEPKSVLEGTLWEDEPWTFDPWVWSGVDEEPWTQDPEPELPSEPTTPEPGPGDAWDGSTLWIDPATGRPYDLGGMEIIVRDWWSNPDAVPWNDYEEARAEYIDYLEETYNFTITQMAISDWGSAPADFVDYVTTGGDDVNYIFTLRDDPATISAMHNGLMYDLSTLDCLDFSDDKFQVNRVHEQYEYDGDICCMYAGYSEPRTGMYFNKRLLEEAGIDSESIYDMQKDGTWTWEAWTEIMSKVQRDINGDGVIDVYGFDANYGMPVYAAVYSNGSEFVGRENGKYVYKYEDIATVQALVFMADTLAYYGVQRPSDAQWDYYKQAFLNGECAFMPEDAYCAAEGGWITYEMTDEIGFVMFPKGPNATDYTNCWTNNYVAIPACYDAERAWKIAFAYDLYTDDVPGYEGFVDFSQYRNGAFDFRAIDETLTMMISKGMITYHGMIPNLDMGEPFLWKFVGGSLGQRVTDVWAIIDSVRDTYKSYIDAANR